jgi:DNA polymerase-3 subunit alpha
MYSLHNHTSYSNGSRGFADSSIKLKDLITTAKKYNLKGICITDHEICGSFVKAKKLEKEFDFPVLLGNEIYLVNQIQADQLKENYNSETMYYPHFLLIGLDMIGNDQIRRLSTIAWENAYMQKGLIRTVTLMEDIKKIVGSNKGHVIGSTACLGSSLNRWILDREINENLKRDNQIEKFITWGINTFGDGNFYLECQPAFPDNIEQWTVNNYILKLSEKYNVPYIITTDSHYLSRELLSLHASFLNSDDNAKEREVDKFYATAYLMKEKEIYEYFKPFWTEKQIAIAIDNTCKIGDRGERFSFNKKQVIPKIKFDNNWRKKFNKDFFPNKEYIQKTILSKFEDDKYLMYLIQRGVEKLIPKEDYEETFNRLEEEIEQFWKVSEKIEDRLHAYFITIAKIIEIMWDEGDSIVGVGRGSGVSSIIDYLLEITQINPLKMPVDMPFYRFITEERPELADLDVDTQSDKREQIFNAVKNYFNNIGGDVINCCTYTTLSAKAAIQTGCRGLKIDTDTAQMMSSMIPVERGFVWSLKDTYYGNEEKNRSPVKEFKTEVDKYKGLLQTAFLVEDLIINRSIHASGVFIVNDDFTKYNAIMRSAKLVRTSQWDLHDSEEFGLVKYDFLTTKALTKIRKTLDFLIKDNVIQPGKTLKDTYNKYINPMTMQYNTDKTWELVGNNEIIDLFQFDTDISVDALSKVKPKSMIELAQTNSLMRLQQQFGAIESPTETYVRFKNNIIEAYKEMDEYKVPKKDQKILEKVLRDFKFVADTQEAIMAVVRIPELTRFTVGESHKLRKAIGKKSESVFAETRQMFYEKGKQYNININTLNYIWEVQVTRQKGYAFSILHCIAYTFIALQELYLYQNYSPIYWNTACLTVNAGADDEDGDKSTNYGKIAKAIGDIQYKGIKVTLPNVNTATFGFKPDVENNQIIFGLKGICGIGDSIAKAIIEKRPYENLKDFLSKMNNYKNAEEDNKFGDSAVITLIKAGAFDELLQMDRISIMKLFIEKISNPLNDLSMGNIETLKELNLLTKDQIEFELRLYKFRKYIYSKKFFTKQTGKSDSTKYYLLDSKFAEPFFFQHFETNMVEDKDYEYNENGNILVKKGSLDREYNKLIENFKEKMLNNKELTNAVNKKRFRDLWEEKVKGTISKWEMDALSFYYHEHELSHINKEKYLISTYEDLPKIPIITEKYMWKGQERPRFKLYKICGTVLDKNKLKHTVTLLTPTGITTIKLYKGQFGFYDKQISHTFEGDNKKTVLEKSWFTRGNKLLVTGYRREDQFVPKKYIDSAYRHTLQLIKDIDENGDLILQTERVDVDELE